MTFQAIRDINLWLARIELKKSRADFYYDLGATLKDRVPLVTTLRKYEIRARAKKKGAAAVYTQMLRALQSGSLSNSLEGIATPTEQTLIDATQTAGDAAIADGLLFISSMVEKTDNMMSSIRKALVYPCGLLLMFSIMLAVFSYGAVPVLAELMPPERWPLSGRILYKVSMIINNYGIVIAIATISCFAIFVFSLPRWVGTQRSRFDRYLPYSLYRDYSGSLLLISLASMMRSGISLRSALERALKFSSPWTRWHIRRILNNLSKPNTPHFGIAFATGILNSRLEERVQDASERRDPVDAFVRMGVGTVERMSSYINKRASQLNGVMLLICGVVLSLMMIGFFSTAMSLQSSLKDSARVSSSVQ